jgi:hypothetical protein
MSERLVQIAQIIEATLRDAAFDIKFLGDYLNKPGDGDYHLEEVGTDPGRVTIRCRGGYVVSIDSPTDVSASDGTVRIFSAAKVELIRERVIASVATAGDEIVVLLPVAGASRVTRAAVLTPVAEFVYVYPSPPASGERHPSE